MRRTATTSNAPGAPVGPIMNQESDGRFGYAAPDMAISNAREGSPDPVALTQGRLWIDGKARVLLCASVFPFRIPRSQWEQRLNAVKRLGYQVIDVYTPWNLYMREPGKADFSGRLDIEEFLRMTKRAGLYALIRPGPYICAEWDGGGLPAWVLTDPKIRARQHDEAFLEAVRTWYQQIIPIISRQQYAGHGHGGPVIMVQADNELDFFDCEDPTGYIGSLASMMREMGVRVPIVVCAGQGDMTRAGADAATVAPAVNLYPDDDDPDFDRQVRYYRHAASRRGAPLIVTETNRVHRTLRRLVGSGAAFIGPYLQVSGWDFDYGTSVNSWGSLEAFMTSDYDFGGAVDPAGGERPEADQARRLSAIINALGDRLSMAQVADEEAIASFASGIRVEGRPLSLEDPQLGLGLLNLAGGGKLLTLTNVSEQNLKLEADSGQGSPDEWPLPAKTGVMLVRDLPLGSGCLLEATSGELTGLEFNEKTGVRVQVDAPDMIPGPLWLRLAFPADTSLDKVRIDGDLIWHPLADTCKDSAQNTGLGDKPVNGLALSGKHGVLRTMLITPEGRKSITVQLGQPVTRAQSSHAPIVRLESVGKAECDQVWSSPSALIPGSRLPMLEERGLWSGSGLYSTRCCPDGIRGMVLRQAADVVGLQWGDLVMPWVANGGGDYWMPLDGSAIQRTDDEDPLLSIRVGIWGHSNFDDTRLQALRLSAGRGLSGVLAVHEVLPLNSGWQATEIKRWSSPAGKADVVLPGRDPVPRMGFGGWSASYWPRVVTYTRSLPSLSVSYPAEAGTSSRSRIKNASSGRMLDEESWLPVGALHFKGCQCKCEVELNGCQIGTITPYESTLWLGPLQATDRLTIRTWQTWGEPTGTIELLVGEPIADWTLRTQNLTMLRKSASRAIFKDQRLPVTCPPGSCLWLQVSRSALAQAQQRGSTIVRMQGQGLQVTAFGEHTNLGRLVLGGLPGTIFAGGRGDLLIVPQEEGDLSLLIESTGKEAGRLETIQLGGAVDLNSESGDR